MSKSKQIETPHLELDALTNALIIATEKIDVITDEISGAFFDSIDPSSEDVKYFFDSNRIKMDIVRDYVVESKESLQQLRVIADAIFDILKNTEVRSDA